MRREGVFGRSLLGAGRGRRSLDGSRGAAAVGSGGRGGLGAQRVRACCSRGARRMCVVGVERRGGPGTAFAQPD
jgi:hypothetical protein